MSSPRGLMGKVLNLNIVGSMFKLQLHHYVHFRVNTLGKGKNPPYPDSWVSVGIEKMN